MDSTHVLASFAGTGRCWHADRSVEIPCNKNACCKMRSTRARQQVQEFETIKRTVYIAADSVS